MDFFFNKGSIKAFTFAYRMRIKIDRLARSNLGIMLGVTQTTKWRPKMAIFSYLKVKRVKPRGHANQLFRHHTKKG